MPPLFRGGVRALRGVLSRALPPSPALASTAPAASYTIGDLAFAISLTEGRYTDPLSLGRHHARVYSQSGEDGVIAEIFRRIGTRDRWFIEIGTGNGVENNTRLLLEQGWRGVWLDGGESEAREAASIFAEYVAAKALSIVNAFVTRDNVDRLLDRAGVPAQVDFLSLDLDHNTSHIWRALRRRSRAACIEYNACLPAAAALEVPYDPGGFWDGTNWFGASLKTLELIGAGKQMHLVGCELMGFNAFFVAAEETAGRFRQPFTADAHWEPARYRTTRSDPTPPSRQARHWVAS